MICKECGNTIDDIAFIGGLCIDCYGEMVGRHPSIFSRIAHRVRSEVDVRRKAPKEDDR